MSNFENLIERLVFEDENDFYYVQVLMRKKDGNETKCNSRGRLIKSYTIKSKEHLWDKAPEIVKLCELFNARAYIHMTPRNNKDILKKALTLIPERYTQSYYNLSNAFDSLCGKTYNKKRRMFLIDLDKEDLSKVYSIASYMIDKFNLRMEFMNDTVSGVHLFYKPFNVQEFKNKFPNIDVHKNNPTLLYYKEKNK